MQAVADLFPRAVKVAAIAALLLCHPLLVATVEPAAKVPGKLIVYPI